MIESMERARELLAAELTEEHLAIRVREASVDTGVFITPEQALRAIAAALSPPIQDERLRKALKTALGHVKHMAAWISRVNLDRSGSRQYSFESLGEDMPDMEAAADKPEGEALESIREAFEAIKDYLDRDETQLAWETANEALSSLPTDKTGVGK